MRSIKKTWSKITTKSAPQHTDGQEYVVCLKKGENYDQVWTEIETETTGLDTIPNRAARILNARPGSPRSCHYSLTPAEAEQLRLDPRVHSVEVPPQYKGIRAVHKTTQFNNFTKPAFPTDSTGDLVNWGLPRMNSSVNNYGTGATLLPGGTGGYDYTLTGQGVDVVIQDSGLQIDHPEFAGRVQAINWYEHTGFSNYSSIDSIGLPGTAYLALNPGAVASTYVHDRNSLYFNGHDWLQFASEAINFGSGDFTIEFFFKIDTDVNLDTTQMGFVDYGANGSLAMYMGTAPGTASSHVFTVELKGTDSQSFDFGYPISKGVWHHLAVTREIGYLNVYLDGNGAGNHSNTWNFTYLSQGFGTYGGVYNFKGHLANLRVSVGSAIYASVVGSITVPTAPLSITSGVVLLLNCLDANTPYHNSVYISYSLVNANNDSTSVVTFSSGTGTPEFTIEFWFNLATDPASHRHAFLGSANDRALSVYTGDVISGGTGPANNKIGVDIYTEGGVTFTFATAMTTGTWYHCAVVRDASCNLQIFLNGIAATGWSTNISGVSPTSGSGHYSNFNFTVNGAIDQVGNWDSYSTFDGAITDVRIVQGTNLYDPTANNIAVPTTMLTAVSGTEFLLNLTYYSEYTGPIDATTNSSVTIEGTGAELIAGPTTVFYQNFQPAEHYMDTVGHGTHVAGIAAGTTYGWAKNAYVYSVKVAGLEGPQDPGTGIQFPDCFEVIQLFHSQKTPRVNGYVKPTVVNMSWGYEGSYVSDISPLTNVTIIGTSGEFGCDVPGITLAIGMAVCVQGTVAYSGLGGYTANTDNYYIITALRPGTPTSYTLVTNQIYDIGQSANQYLSYTVTRTDYPAIVAIIGAYTGSSYYYPNPGEFTITAPGVTGTRTVLYCGYDIPGNLFFEFHYEAGQDDPTSIASGTSFTVTHTPTNGNNGFTLQAATALGEASGTAITTVEGTPSQLSFTVIVTNITGGHYRGTPWTGTFPQTNYGMGPNDVLYYYSFPVRDPSTDVALEDLIDAGVIVSIAAGNAFIKIDNSGGPDYLNSYTDGTYTYYYNQGSSPYSVHANIVGSIDVTPYDVNRDQKAEYSNSGPGVNIFAPGTGILSCTSNNPAGIYEEGYTPAPYFLDSAFNQLNLSGTSMASPQITGLSALLAEMNPQATPSQILTQLQNMARNNLYTTNSANDYSVFNSLWGASPKLVYNQFNNTVSAYFG